MQNKIFFRPEGQPRKIYIKLIKFIQIQFFFIKTKYNISVSCSSDNLFGQLIGWFYDMSNDAQTIVTA